MFAGTDDGQVVFVNQSTENVTIITTGLPKRWVTSIAADPHNASSIYVTLSGFRFDEAGAHVYKSNNLGKVWEDISFTLPDLPVNDIIIDPEEVGTLYIATDVGVFYSKDDGKNWELLGGELPLVPVTDIDFHKPSRTLAAATYGRSIFTYALPFSTPTYDNSKEENLSLHPNPSTNFIQVSGLKGKQNISIYNLEGRLITSQLIGNNEPLDIVELRSGVYLLKVKEKTIRFIKI